MLHRVSLRSASISPPSLFPIFQFPFSFKSLHHSLLHPAKQQFFSVRHVYDCNVRIQQLSRAADIKAARQLFDNMPARDVVSWNSIITAYWKNGYLQEAKKLFNSMPGRNILSWNSMIAGCVENGCLDEAFQYFKAMPQRNTESYNAMVSGFVRCERVGDAGMLFQEMPRKNVISYTAMIYGYMKVGEFEKARALFDEMPLKNDVSWTVMISGYADNGWFDEARELYQRMPNKNVVAMTALISGYFNDGRVEDARTLFYGIRCKDLACWNAMITGYAQNGIGEEALKLYLEMVKLAIQPDIFTLVSVTTACSGLASIKEGRQMHVLVIKYGFEFDLSLCHSLITMYSKCGSILDAEQAFGQINGTCLVSWNTIISAFAQHGLYEKAVDFFNQMEVVGVEPDGVTFLSLLCACGHAGEVNKSQLEKASKIIREMPFEADGGIWGALLGACSVYLNVELGELAAKKLVEWNPHHSGAYVVLSNIYAAAGMWDEVTRVRLQMKEQGVKKQCAYSRMEIGNKVHHFLGGDLSHPETDKIHLEIKSISLQMKALVNIAEIDLLWGGFG
ncbi:pentatricopeptide repeat-containing protein At4g02750-like isoform X2 [Hibiscus syriacus]|uniref:pentatricopeptide repeat-containing protein At4g02750-like isoform X2 n=1 Tax=Hibiscus syriacus TaxID=106335 RepID=UPI0019205AD3|nr:pentatricopeptide repeat-containing protein At4g02750-like isoform X2 [Hibiscus syriacus]